MDKFIYTSLTRISPLAQSDFDVREISRAQWENGDYVAARVVKPGSHQLKVELSSGRMVSVMEGDLLIGALGVRHATLEATGDWKAIASDNMMTALTGAGLFGKLTSKSVFIPEMMQLKYLGHIFPDAQKATMQRYVAKVPPKKLGIPVVLFVGTSMSSGKTTAARVFTHELKSRGLRVVSGKLTGAGRYRDVLTIKDAGAVEVFDFVDAGLPSSIVPKEDYRASLKNLLSMIAAAEADIAVIEIGASPLEPYNGDTAIEAIKEQICFSVLCASDPYAVYGVMKSFDFEPDLVTGIATNTRAGIELIDKLTGMTALNIIDPEDMPEVRLLLSEKLKGVLKN